MRPREAIELLKNMKWSITTKFNTVNNSTKALDMAISALEKQVPKKPSCPIDTWVCPDCGRDVEYQAKMGDNILFHGQYDFCPNCGRPIDWTEGEG